MDKHRGDNFAVEQVGALCSRNDGSTGKALIMPQQVLDQERFTGLALPDENNDLVVLDFGHVEFLETEIQATVWRSNRHLLAEKLVLFEAPGLEFGHAVFLILPNHRTSQYEDTSVESVIILHTTKTAYRSSRFAVLFSESRSPVSLCGGDE